MTIAQTNAVSLGLLVVSQKLHRTANCQTRIRRDQVWPFICWKGSGLWQNGLVSRIHLLQGAEIGLNVELCVFGGLFAASIPMESTFPRGIQVLFYNWSI